MSKAPNGGMQVDRIKDSLDEDPRLGIDPRGP